MEVEAVEPMRLGRSNVDLDWEANALVMNEMRNLCSSWIYPAALRVVLDLQVPHILAAKDLPGHRTAMMSAQELMQHMQAPRPNPLNLERILRLLTCKAIFTEHIDRDGGDGDDQHPRVVRRFSLTPLSRVLVPGNPGGSIANIALLLTISPEYAMALPHVSGGILTSDDPFKKAHGVNQFEYMKTHPAFLRVFKDSFTEHTNTFAHKFVKSYHGLASVRKLVDVGGSSGEVLSHIVQKYPHIHGVNFDLPEVVTDNPNIPGVEQVGGDMFEKVPGGCDAIFMKMILHDWDDEQCLKILKNCHAALPSHGSGKLIIVEMLMPEETPVLTGSSTPTDAMGVFQLDFLMQLHCPNGRERSKAEYERLAKRAGFTTFEEVGRLGFFHVMESFK